ncbi:MAG: DinB family protein [Chloroflexi bacterium]|nr:DinB family protein [Chloroflexota bacterium]
MLTSIDAFLRYFDAVNRRAMRDIAALPPEADGWTPATGEGEKAWSINKLIGHMAGSRLYFASAYRGEGWISPAPPDVSSRDRWLPALEESVREFRRRLEGTPAEWLERKVQMIDSEGGLSGWRVLMMMMEHDIHHRSQIDTYAGANGWDVPQIYNRAAETIGALQEQQRAKHGLTGEGHAL